MSEASDVSALIPAEASIGGTFGGSVRSSGPAGLLHVATHDLLRIESVADAAEIVASLVARLGAQLVPAHSAPPDALRIDCSLGLGEVRFPCSENPAVISVLRETLPGFLDDVGVTTQKLGAPAGLVDPRTALLTAEAGERRLHRLEAGDAVVALALKGLSAPKPIGDRFDADAVTADLARVLHEQGRCDDAFVATEERGRVLALLRRPGPEGVSALVRRLDAAWRESRAIPIDLLAAHAFVDAAGGPAAASCATDALRSLEARPASVAS